MGKSLVIVESPAKAKTINKYLGADYVVKSSVGHIRDLPTSGTSTGSKERKRSPLSTKGLSQEEKEKIKKQQAYEQLVRRMGIDPLHGWKADYRILPGKEKVVRELKSLAQKADKIYLATDLDREGEAIAWHLKEVLGGDDDRFLRVTFNEITKKAIQEAFAHPHALNIDRVNAQQARRFLDRLVGYTVSPLLWKKVARGLSAGRVQSVAVRLIVEREREIRAFVPEEYWEIEAVLKSDAHKLPFKVVRKQGEKFVPRTQAEADSAVEQLRQANFVVTLREDKPTKSKSPAPFITSTLQAAASTRLGFGVKRTMVAAQRLYEAGLITYMRTDSTNLSQDALTAARDYIQKNLGPSYLPAKPKIYRSKGGAQEAHEAIRPTDVNLAPESLTGVDLDGQKLYDLIWRQFLASQMPDAEYLSTTVTVEAGGFELQAKGRIVKFDGWTKILPPPKSKDAVPLPDLRVGQALELEDIEASQHFTRPPARYTEAALVKELEKRGIGRPSTYANIISTIQERGYVSQKNRRFYAEKMGEIVTDRLTENFENLMDYGFTASMEETLDEIAEGKKDWLAVLDAFYADLCRRLEQAEAPVEAGGMRPNQAVETDIKCDKCGRPMAIRAASTGFFLACTGYRLSGDDKCKNTINLLPGDEFVQADASDDEAESRALAAKHRCQKCGNAMDSFLIDEKRRLHVCGNFPDCDGYEIEQGQFKLKGYDGPVLECDKCGAEMQLKTGRFGKYFGCTNENCKNTRKLLKNGQPAPPKAEPIPMPWLKCDKVDDHFVLRDGASGLFLAASQFPKHRETRAPKVKEIQQVKDKLDPKYRYLVDAPAEDPKGRDAIIRFSRKTQTQYVMSEDENGKPTGWVAFYKDGRWEADASKMKK
ncbi:MAG: type I DNA topoisomerase [Gammaproteobacteria bacterium]|nr:MAG: type I DNA topoisomerase [Gammaproteobacteria bacterium]